MAARTPVTPGLFRLEAGAAGPLLGGHCPACGRMHFPRAGTCPYCGTAPCEERALSPEGTLYLFTAVHSRPPGYRGEVPFGIGVVELPEGVRIVARLTEARVERLRAGMRVRFALVLAYRDEAGGEVVTYGFSPLEEGGT
jgi:hypothetical protein